MSILVIDDSRTIRSIIQAILIEAGYDELLFAESAQDALQKLGVNSQQEIALNTDLNIDLILLDIILPDLDGREVCRIIKSQEYLQDTPVIMVTALTQMENLEKAFLAGAMDYITKPINNVELLARIRSALKLKSEMDRRKAREQRLLEVTRQLEEAVEKLNRLSSIDGLTGVANRRRFDEYISLEWSKGKRNIKPLSLIMIDIDYFKNYNDTYGHQAGDECLITVAATLKDVLRRPGDLVCRYGGEEFAVILPETPINGAVILAEKMCDLVQSKCIAHEKSQVCDCVTISLGVAATLPNKYLSPKDLIAGADTALYSAKHEGRNRIKKGTIDYINSR